MAYANILDVAAVDKNEIFCRVRDFICKRNGTYDYSTTGIGWTLIDESYATDEDNCAINDWYVIYSPGEGGKDDLYIQIKWVSGYIACYGWQSWDVSTHAGSTSNRYGTASNWTTDEAIAGPFWVYGDLDSVLCVHYLSSVDYRSVAFGTLLPGYTNTSGVIATCSTTLAAGSDVSIVVDAVPSEWEVGSEIFIRTTHNNDMATVEVEKITIKTIVSNTITADLTNSYTTGSCLSNHLGYYCQSGRYFPASNMLIDTGGFQNSLTVRVSLLLLSTAFDPEALESRYPLVNIFHTTGNGMGGIMKNIKYSTTYGVTPPQLTYQDVLEESDGTQWRTFKLYNGQYVAVLEV